MLFKFLLGLFFEENLRFLNSYLIILNICTKKVDDNGGIYPNGTLGPSISYLDMKNQFCGRK